MKPIAPGTLCLIVSRPLAVPPSFLIGRTVTVLARLSDRCPHCGSDQYLVKGAEPFDHGCRPNLQPILPPGVDTNVVDKRDLKVPA